MNVNRQAKSDLRMLLGLPDSTVLPYVGLAMNTKKMRKDCSLRIKPKAFLNERKQGHIVPNSDPKCNMSYEERKRLNELGERLQKKKRQNASKSRMFALDPYIKANVQLQRVLNGKRNIREKGKIKSSFIEKVMDTDQCEIKVCSIIQCVIHQLLLFI